MIRIHDPSATDPTTGAEQRAAERLTCPVPTTVRLLAAPRRRPLRVHVRDVSVKGVGLISPELLDVGAELALDWTFGPTEAWRTLLVRVIHITPYHAGRCLVGCAFETPITEDEVSRVVCRFSRGPSLER
jgi:hypothetical protein